MLGNVFSPRYYAARARGRAAALDFVAVNVALYGPRGKRWVMTERAGATRQARALRIGASRFSWNGDALEVDLREVCAPWPRPLSGRVVVHPELVDGRPRVLDTAGAHQWCPIAPLARVEVELREPALRFRGNGYLDSNVGAAPLETAFRSWRWSRFSTPRGASVFYDVERRDGTHHAIDIAFDRRGSAEPHARTALSDLGAAGWGIDRPARAAGAVELVRTLEDTPFYARSHVRLGGAAPAEGVHESLDLDRFEASWVRALLPMRTRRER
jgi:carotenoid 1,2-hydratase